MSVEIFVDFEAKMPVDLGVEMAVKNIDNGPSAENLGNITDLFEKMVSF